MQLVNPLAPAMVLKSEIAYGWGWSAYAGPQLSDGDLVVYLRGSTFLRWIRKGYWQAVWERYFRIYRMTIFDQRTLLKVLDAFTKKAKRHLRRKLGTSFRGVELFYPCEINSFGVQGAIPVHCRRTIIIDGRIRSFSDQKLRVIAVLARQYQRIERETRKAA